MGLVLCISGITYAYLRKEKVQEYSNAVSSISCLNVEFINEKDVINLKDAFPIPDNEALATIRPYKFTIRNTCSNDVSAEINLESLQVNDQLSKEYVKIEFTAENDESPLISILGALPDREPIITNATSDNLTTVNIKGYGEKSFALRLWIDYDTTLEQGFNKYYEGKIGIKAAPLHTLAKVYGVRRDIDSESSSWERIGASTNSVANAQFGDTPVRNDFDNIYPWSAIDTYAYNLSTGEEISLTEVGISEFPFTGTDSEGNEYEILTRIPEFYYRRYQQTESDGKTYEYILISKDLLEGFNKSDVFSVGRYMISELSSAAHSRSGALPLVSTTITDFRTYSKKLGSDFGQLDYRYFILQLLYLVEYADYNSQAKLGIGNTNNNVVLPSGGCNNLGMKSGTLTNSSNANYGKVSMIYRGIEDIYGNTWQYIDGININDFQTYVCYNPSNYAVDTFTGCYNPIGYANTNILYGGISMLGYDMSNPLIAMPISDGGNTYSHIADSYWVRSSKNILLVSGSYANKLAAGLFAVGAHVDSSYKNSTVGARLLRYN